jgi:hypothetical protein
MESLNNAFTGGLIDHLLRVASYAVKFNTALPENEKSRPNIFLKVCFTPNYVVKKTFKPCESKWHVIT